MNRRKFLAFAGAGVLILSAPNAVFAKRGGGQENIDAKIREYTYKLADDFAVYSGIPKNKVLNYAADALSDPMFQNGVKTFLYKSKPVELKSGQTVMAPDYETALSFLVLAAKSSNNPLEAYFVAKVYDLSLGAFMRPKIGKKNKYVRRYLDEIYKPAAVIMASNGICGGYAKLVKYYLWMGDYSKAVKSYESGKKVCGKKPPKMARKELALFGQKAKALSSSGK